ncbi:hypothetical protein KIH74_05615 [Kineosporia sp. J2-2]|uniref:Polyketide cyclase / dehydrase and lipid transport n=1 Tax=Kineosporia corallincola TaxID=2835133 RepID=A0ABS5TBD9_9ACTN|nr:hypothetical protein [Kineosporia corallincola]MBT0768391.1 hypothetical protein [Kineosporia corallincola]
MNAGYELPLPAAEIVEHLNARQRIPFSPWSLRVSALELIPRQGRLPLVELTVDVSAEGADGGAGDIGPERWAVRVPVRKQALVPGASPQPFLLFLRVRLEEWWLTRARNPKAQARRLA